MDSQFASLGIGALLLFVAGVFVGTGAEHFKKRDFIFGCLCLFIGLFAGVAGTNVIWPKLVGSYVCGTPSGWSNEERCAYLPQQVIEVLKPKARP